MPNYIDTMQQSTTTIAVPQAKVEVPFGTRLWKFGMDKVYLPFYKNFMVGKRGDRRDRYKTCVNKVLEWEMNCIIPCHGDVIKGSPDFCRNILYDHFHN